MLSLGLLSLVPAFVLLRVWRHVPLREAFLAFLPSLAIVVVCLTAPTRWDGLDELATWSYGGGMFVAVRAYLARGLPARRWVVLIVLMLAGLEQFTQAYLPWWGGGSVARRMVGTFYWHNQFAAFLLAIGLVALVLAARGHGAVRLTGWLVTPWCVAAVLFSGSRASIGLFALLSGVALVIALIDRRGRIATVAVLALGVGLSSLLSSPLLMEQSGSAAATVEAREAEQSAAGNGMARLEYWRAAVLLGSERPVTGAGFDTFATAGAARMPTAATASPFVHNGFLQAFSDGGLLLLVTTIVATGLPTAVAARSLARRRCRDRDPVSGPAVALGALALMLHSAVDFDWVYPSLLALLAILFAVAMSAAGPVTRNTDPVRSIGWVLVAALLVVAVPAASRASALRATELQVPAWVVVSSLGVPVRGDADWLPNGARCRDGLFSSDPLVLRDSLRCSAAAAMLDPSLELLRAGAEVELGQEEAGIRRGRRVIAEHASERPMLRVAFARVLRAAGHESAALTQLRLARTTLVERGLPTDPVDRILEIW